MRRIPPTTTSRRRARSGTPTSIAPPTFAVVVAQRAEAQLIDDPEAGIDFSRVVHADERFTHHRPIHAGDRLVTVLHVDAITERAGLAMVTTRCEIAAEDGDAGRDRDLDPRGARGGVA